LAKQTSFAHFLEFQVAEGDFDAGAATEAFGQLFGEVDGAVLAAGAAEGDHKIFEAAGAIGGNAGVDEREDAGEKLVNGFLLIEVVDYGRVFAGERFEAIFAAGIGEAAAVENKAAAVAGFVFRQALMERKTENADEKIVGVSGETLKLLGGEHAFEGAEESGEFNRELGVVEKPAKIFQGVGDALEEVGFAFVEAAETVGAESLEDSNVNVGVEMLHEGGAIEIDVASEFIEIVIEKLLTKLGREIGLGVVEERGDVVLESALAAALIVNEEGLAVTEHDVAGLKIAVEKIIARGAEKKIGEAREIVFEGLLVERDAG
jgi:hypothetical protein